MNTLVVNYVNGGIGYDVNGGIKCFERDLKMGSRCKLNDLFGLPYPEKWSPPLGLAGPVLHI